MTEQRTTWILEGVPVLEIDDHGQAMIAEIAEDPKAEDGVFVRVQSWLENCHDPAEAEILHPIAHLRGKRVRITVEVLD